MNTSQSATSKPKSNNSGLVRDILSKNLIEAKKNRTDGDLSVLPQSFQQEISLTTAKIEHIFHQGDTLIEKSEPLDAAVIEEELEELQRYCQEVFGRVERYYKKLIRLPVRYE